MSANRNDAGGAAGKNSPFVVEDRDVGRDKPDRGGLALCGWSGIGGDNAGLSRERAGEVAGFLPQALALPPEAISFEWAGDTRPIATNATPEGRAQNRRVEVLAQ